MAVLNPKTKKQVMKSKLEKPKEKREESEAEEWDLSQGMGILPDNVSLTQNIGCVGGKNKKEISPPLKPKK